MSTIDVFSYIANIVFVTWGVIDYLSRKREKKIEANGLIGIYEMAARLSLRLPGFFSQQAQDIACAIKSLIFNAKGRERNDVDYEAQLSVPKSEIKKSRSA